MKAITLWQPWATYIAIGSKRYETRSWATPYRGPLAIHASVRKMTEGERDLLDDYPLPHGHGPMPFGAVVATCDLVECIRMTDAAIAARECIELDLGDWSPGRFAWCLVNVVRLPVPIPAKGAQGLWDWIPPASRTERGE